MESIARLGVLELSNVERSLQISARHICEDLRTADGTLRRDFIATKHTFRFTWKFLAESSDDVADGGAGMKDLVALDPTVIYALELDDQEGGSTSYQVLVEPGSPSWNIVERDRGGAWFYEVSLDLVEV